ncbi:MAG: DNA-directed polymerase subunit beta [Pseudomonadota bacterium]
MLNTIRHSFSKLSFDCDVLNRSLKAIHRNSYDGFLYGQDENGFSLQKLLKSFFPIVSKDNYARIDFISVRIEKPSILIEECKEKNLTYSSNCYITLRYTLFDNSGTDDKPVFTLRTIKEQEMLLCSIPMMTPSSSFIINGIEKVVVSQIHKSPGVFFNRKLKDNGLMSYNMSFIPYYGSRLEVIFESKSLVNFRIDKKKKMPLLHLFNILGLSKTQVSKIFYKQLLLTKHKDLFLVGIKLQDNIGSSLSLNLRDEKGDIVHLKGSVVSRAIAKKTPEDTKFYCKIEDLDGKIIYEESEIAGISYDAFSIITNEDISNFAKSDIKEIKIIDENIKSFNEAIINTINNNKNFSVNDSLQVMMKVIRPGVPFSLDVAKGMFERMFFNPAYCNFFAVGRYKVNSVLYQNQKENSTVLTMDDIITGVKKLSELFASNAVTEDTDSLSNRRIRCVGELLENQMRASLVRIIKNASDKLSSITLDTAVLSDLISTAPLNKAIKDFFAISELSQFMEQTNILSEIAHTRKLSAMGPGGITRERASAEIRDIHYTQYGRICHIETPDGQNIGLITSLASHATINKYGFIETPYRKVINGKITDDVVYLDATQEKNCYIGNISKDIVKDNQIIADIVSARYNGDIIFVSNELINYVDVAPRQTISAVASLIPFLENNDTARALMGCNMQRQAVPLMYPNAPFVGTGMESKLALESSAVVLAENEGRVVNINADLIAIEVEDRKNSNQNLIDVYRLKKFKRTNQGTFINQQPIVSMGEYVKKGQIIADGPATHNGELALGQNVLVAFMPWNGYNYEDSIVISKKLISDDKFTSMHIEEFEITVRDTRLGVEEITRDIYGVNEEALKHLDEYGIVHIGTNVKAGDILVGKISPRSEAPITSEEKLLKAIFGEKVSNVKNSSLIVPPGVHGTVVDIQILTRRGQIKDGRALQIENQQLAKRKLQKDYEIKTLSKIFSDKVEHIIQGESFSVANKKSTEKITQKEFPKLHITQKLTIKIDNNDVKTKEISSLKSQFETMLAKIESNAQEDYSKIADGVALSNGVLKVVKVFVATRSKLQPGDKLAGRHGNKGVISIVVPTEDMPFMEDGTSIDMIFSPISVPGRMNIGQVLETHLGLISKTIGQQVDEMLTQKQATDNIRKFLNEIAIDDKFKQKIAQKNENEIISFAKSIQNGMYFETPVFDGASIDDIEKIASKLNIPKTSQVKLFDGKTGEAFARPVTVGYMYVIKLHHLVEDKMHARSTGKYSLVTQQPLGGKSHAGGQRFGEMECWALQAYGAAYTLQEMLTSKSDDVYGRKKMYEAIINGETKFYAGTPESFNVSCKELRSLGFDIEFGLLSE